MTALASQSRTVSGLRPVDVRRDLGAIASLIEVCFGDQLDQSGRNAVREKQALSRYGPLLWLFGSLAQRTSGWQLGFVWVENGRLVGNVGVQPSAADRTTWLIANVAVHPDYRRRGIARRLMYAALEMAAEQGGAVTQLQVNEGNAGAKRLYQELNFDTIAVHTLWERRDRSVPALRESAQLDVRLTTRREWPAEYALLAAERPEGLEWERPLDPKRLRPSLSRALNNFLNGKREERWVVGRPDRPDGWLYLQLSIGRPDQMALVVRRQRQADLESALLERALRRLGRRPWALRIEHPAGQSVELLQSHNFRPLRTLRWMRRAL